jgi:peptide-methionine (R)-S-oxide reductase
MKYNSQTGWPSFNNHIYGHLRTYTDLKSFPPARGYRCVRCKGHQGHLFMDGPLPSGERWCNNGAALKFIPA